MYGVGGSDGGGGVAEGYILCSSFIIPDTLANVLLASIIHIDILIKSLLIGVVEEKRKKEKKSEARMESSFVFFEVQR